jgi:hypothetical protein
LLIYKIQNKINDKIYIGQTIRSLEKRIWRHLYKNSGCFAIHNALNKYGIENFDISIIKDGVETIEELNRLEQENIQKFNSMSPNGYNLNSGGKNHSLSEETKRKLSESHKGVKSYLYGKHHSEEVRKKISLSQKGVPETEKTKKINSEAHKGQKAWNKGVPLSDEQKDKISKSLIGRVGSNLGKKFSEQSRYNISKAHIGIYPSSENLKKRSESMKEVWRKKKGLSDEEK